MTQLISKTKKALILSSGLLLVSVTALTGCSDNSKSAANIPAPGDFQIQSVSAVSPSDRTFDITWSNSTQASDYQVCLFDPSYANHCLRLIGSTSQTHQRVPLGNYQPTAPLEFFVIAKNSAGYTVSSTTAKFSKVTHTTDIVPV